MTDAEIIAVVKAHMDGKSIEHRARNSNNAPWLTSTPNWSFSDLDYRVKPEPREWWINRYADAYGDRVYATEELADNGASFSRLECIHVREVLEDKS